VRGHVGKTPSPTSQVVLADEVRGTEFYELCVNVPFVNRLSRRLVKQGVADKFSLSRTMNALLQRYVDFVSLRTC